LGRNKLKILKIFKGYAVISPSRPQLNSVAKGKGTSISPVYYLKIKNTV